MASLLLRPLFRPSLMGASLGLGLFATHAHFVRPSKLDSPSSAFSASSYNQNAKVPVLERSRSGSRLNPAAVRQISSGSIIGLCGGLLISTFSRSLALIIGLLVLGLQYASSKGINIIPTERIQRYVKGVDVRSAVQDNVAFKVAFGVTFALAGFARF